MIDPAPAWAYQGPGCTCYTVLYDGRLWTRCVPVSGCSGCVYVNCSGTAVSGEMVSIMSGGNLITSGLTGPSGQFCFPVSGASGGIYNVFISGNGHASLSVSGVYFGCSGYHYNVCGGCNVTVCASACSGNYAVSGALVTIKSGGMLVVSGYTTAQGCVSGMNLGASGSYQLGVSGGGPFGNYSGTRSIACGSIQNVSLALISTPTVTFTVKGCCSTLLPGATVSIDGADYTTNSSGQVVWYGTDSGTYEWTISKSRFVSQSGSFTLTECGTVSNVNVQLVAAGGYACAVAGLGELASCCWVDPIPTSMVLSDSCTGGCTLSYNGTFWEGTADFTMPAFCGIPLLSCTCLYEFPGPLAICNSGSSTNSCLVTMTLCVCSTGGSSEVSPTCCPNVGGGFGITECCLDNTLCATSSSIDISSSIPAEVTFSIPACACVKTEEFGDTFYSCGSGGGVCYCAGNGPMISITE